MEEKFNESNKFKESVKSLDPDVQEFKDPLRCLCLADPVATSWFHYTGDCRFE